MFTGSYNIPNAIYNLIRVDTVLNYFLISGKQEVFVDFY